MSSELIRTKVTKEDVILVLEKIIDLVRHSSKVKECNVSIENGMKEGHADGYMWVVQKVPDGLKYIDVELVLDGFDQVEKIEG